RRGRRIGRELLDACVQVAKRRNATSMMLEVRSTNENAIGMYEGLGFHAIATRSRYYSDGGDAVIMRLRPLEVSP
ncbi:MAG: GNAT family N-acetyltransferase, partial [Actinomycetota bacterium]|nr:GNAT family N-acetyltransferase [Actinomycetota bacterium]